ncbi:carboxylating nicotinate-nucleotide diphosphorylase [Clostridium mediterraneense]|uniref:carboxylating nicotinate-nucleotide diphosphorylase n=1 Tax=Clostridium mediterraneense TaxID=1805472 RepID=UPI000831F3F4|nr:carboxylating nicotinate-nucleotide diphosphorylase [Clostridium mediterraneense]
MNGLDNFIIDKYLRMELEEDVVNEDITTNSIVDKNSMATCELICKEEGVLAGIEVFKRVFEILGDVKVNLNFEDGEKIKNKDVIAVLEGNTRNILIGERTALNYLQRMSGIASLTNKMVKELEGSKTKLLDTRKTTPNMKVFEKYAVRVGGGCNHRFNLSDGILIKDNHIGAAGGIKQAIRLAKEYAPFVRKIEVEVETIDGVLEALEEKADIIMLDNMDNETLKKSVELIGDKALTECSGNITKERLSELKKIGVNYISSGALTHSAKILDFSMKNLKIK